MKPRVVLNAVDHVHLNPFKRTWLIDDRVDSASMRWMLCDRVRHTSFRHVSCKERVPWEHSPSRKKKRQMSSIKGGAAKRNCFTAPNYLPRPINQWDLQMPAPSLATWRPLGRPRGLAWPLPRVHVHSGHLGSLRGLAWLCYVTLRVTLHPRRSRAPHQLRKSCENKCPFLQF